MAGRVRFKDGFDHCMCGEGDCPFHVIYGHWTILEVAPPLRRPSGGWITQMRAECVCGTIRLVLLPNLIRGLSKSCGCVREKQRWTHRFRHGDARKGRTAREYTVWQAMRKRCMSPQCAQYGDYGGRGIMVCERWMQYENFLADMGRRPSSAHSLDRFPDVNGNYEPGNCRWATSKQQRANQRKRARLDQFTDEELTGELSRRAALRLIL
jgi:hypothetical protein